MFELTQTDATSIDYSRLQKQQTKSETHNQTSESSKCSTQQLHTNTPTHTLAVSSQTGWRAPNVAYQSGRPHQTKPIRRRTGVFLKTNFESKYLLFTGMPLPDQRLVIMASPPRRFHRVATLGSAHMRSGCYVSGSAPINVPRGIVLPQPRYDHMLPIAGHWTAIEIRRSYR